MNGIIPLYKPCGMTSADCVYQLRKILQERKIGHTGTLDPQVDGVLVICVGQATKLVNYLMRQPKTYHGQITLGKATTTEDATSTKAFISTLYYSTDRTGNASFNGFLTANSSALFSGKS